MGETQEFYSTLVANCIVNAFFSYTAIALNTVTIQALRKTLQIPDFKNTASESGCIGSFGWFTYSASVHCISSLITTGFCYYKIYAIIRRLKNQICALQIQQAGQNDGMANTVRLRKTAVGTFYVYIAFLACYGPLFCVLLSLRIYGETTLLLQLWYYAMTLVFMNSSLNPLIYCLKMRQVRQVIIMEILRNIRFLSQ